MRGTEEERVEEMGEDLPGSGENDDDPPYSGNLPDNKGAEEKPPGGVPPSGRQEWEVLTPSQIDLIEDPKPNA